MGRRRDGCHSSGSSNEPVRHTPRLLPPAARQRVPGCPSASDSPAEHGSPSAVNPPVQGSPPRHATHAPGRTYVLPSTSNIPSAPPTQQPSSHPGRVRVRMQWCTPREQSLIDWHSAIRASTPRLAP